MIVSLDTETELIRPGVLAPELVCVSLAWSPTPARPEPVPLPPGAIVERRGSVTVALLDAYDGLDVFRELLAAEDVVIVGANLTFDMGVFCAEDPELTPAVFAAFESGRISDVQIRERLIRLAEGRLRGAGGRVGLAALVGAYLSEADASRVRSAKRGRPDDSAAEVDGDGEDEGEAAREAEHDPWRLRYAELAAVPLAEWPDAAVTYPLDDAHDTLRVWWAQCEGPEDVDGFTLRAYDEGPTGPARIVSEDREARAAWALHLCALWGLRTDPEAVEAAIATWRAEEAASLVSAEAGGWFRPAYVGPRGGTRAAGVVTKALRAAVVAAWGTSWADEAPLTPKGAEARKDGEPIELAHVSTSRDALLAAAGRAGASEHLRGYAAGLQARKRLAVWGPALVAGTKHALTSRPLHLVATGRTSWSSPPLQQPPKKGAVRECFVARDGYVFVFADVKTAELCAVAQICMWEGFGSALLDAINAGRDIHCMLAERLDPYGRSEAEIERLYRAGDPEADALRHTAKIGNFSLWGGLGAASLAGLMAGALRRPVGEDEARETIRAWRQTWPEHAPYFERVAEVTRPPMWGLPERPFTFQQYVSGRLRGRCGYTDGCNTQFQGLVADIAKAALWEVAREAYAVPDSPLYGSRPVLMLHDEIGIEAPEGKASEAAARLGAVIESVAREHAPDVRWEAEPVLVRRWKKGAKATKDAAGRLVVTP